MIKKLLIVVIPLLLLALVWMLFFWTPNKTHNISDSQDLLRGGDFSLNSFQGKRSLNDFRGNIVLIYFGYTWCPDVCPTNLSMMSAAFLQLEQQELAQVQGIFISVDPARDTVERLAEYTEFFHPKIMGLTGTVNEVNQLAKRYGVSYRLVKQESATDYVVDHSSETYVVGQTGKLLDVLPHAAPPDQILLSIRKHLAKKGK